MNKHDEFILMQWKEDAIRAKRELRCALLLGSVTVISVIGMVVAIAMSPIWS